jgi:hypothetical protein
MLLLTAFLVAGACSDESRTSVATPQQATTEATSQAANLTPEELGELGAKIEKQPGDAEKILSEKGLNEESFEQAIRKVAEDPAASKRYAESYKKAKA